MNFFWKLWWIGIAITIATRITINHLTCDGYTFIDELKKSTQILMHLLVIICINLVGGIAVAKFLGIFAGSDIGVLGYILAAIIPAILTYLVGFNVLGLNHFDNFGTQLCFLVVFIVSIIGWTIPISKYNIEK